MAGKILNLNLYYKGKHLDTAVYKRDFTSQFIVGTDPNIFWQILDRSFPSSHKLVTKKGDNYEMHLLKGMNVEVKRDEKVLTMDELKSSKKVQGNRLILDQATNGFVHYGKDYSIEYTFKNPYRKSLTAEDREAIRKYGKYATLDSGVKFTLMFILLCLIITAVSLGIVGKHYAALEKEKKATSIVDLVKKRSATRVQVDTPKKKKEIVEKPVKTQTKTEVDKVDRTKQDQKEIKKTQKAAKQDLQKQLAQEFGDLGVDLTDTEPVEEEMIVQFNKEEVLSTGGGVSLGGTKKSSNIKASEDLLGGGDTDLSAGFGEGIGDLGDLGGLGDLSDVGLEVSELDGDILGSVDTAKITKIAGKKEFQAAATKFAFATAISEEEDELGSGLTTEQKTIKGKIDQLIRSYSPQLDRIYDIEKHKGNYYGVMSYTLLINNDGSVAAVDMKAAPSSNFSQVIYDKFHKEIMTWKLDVGGELKYTFKKTFRRN